MKKLSDYDGEIYITQTKKLGGGYRAYCMDGWPKGRGTDGDMAHRVGLTSCHCCDYFMFRQGAISFLEISEMWRTKEEFKERYPNISRKETGNTELFREHIVKECILKLYGGMLVLCWFAHLCSSEAKRLRAQKYHFFLVFCGANKHQDAKMLDGIKRELQGRMRNIASERCGAPSVIREVHVLSTEKFKEKLESGAVPPA